ncbi:hypothetical protein [Fusibacter sp. 3D3]|uniref:hypothetical protein n=1 Tax=Fusibacter sp. 3D3 TaxID=1048380 RepID=UPI000852B787|nr:hypothetical protein [Fusibacter sp. 3D3]
MKNKNIFIITILIYIITAISLIIGLSLPVGDTFLERLLVNFNLPAYTQGNEGLYIPGAQLFVVILISWLILKWLYRDQVSLWKNGLLLLIVLIVLLWKVIIY